MRYVKALALGSAIACVLVLAACGEEADQAGAPETTTVEKTVTEEAPSESGGSGEAAGGDEGGGGGKIEVPDVVGEDHQLAQDTMQAAGLYNLTEEDATGQDRLLIVDRNWTVVEQEPPAGTRVKEGETIILRSKKDGE